MQKKRLLTGDRPTGKLHIGHYVGSLKNRVDLQDKYDCFLVIADLHSLTTKPHKEQIAEIPFHIHDMVLDYLASGIDPKKTTIFVQSAISGVYELNLIFEMLITVPTISRVPSIKEMARAANMDDDAIPFGLLGYPVLQAADILLPRANLVPVGKDNLANVEVAREIAHRFNSLYHSIFPVPEPILGTEEVLVGIDGKSKMSKSLNNAIFLSDSTDVVRDKVFKMFTDPKRIHANIPGRVEGNPVFIYHDFFNNNKAEIDDLKDRYRQGRVEDREVKEKLNRTLNDFLDPIRERRSQYEKKSDQVTEIIRDGNNKMNAIANETLQIVRDAMGLNYFR